MPEVEGLADLPMTEKGDLTDLAYLEHLASHY